MPQDRVRVDWSRCQADSGCAGSALPPWGRCLRHLDADDLDQAIKRAKTEGLDARGVSITSALLEHIISLLDLTDQGGLPVVPKSSFDGATFTQDAGFNGATFTRRAEFNGATFTRRAEFNGATFHGRAGFSGASFGPGGLDRATFTGVTFEEDAEFDGAIFHGDAEFDWATFSRRAKFDRATFSRRAKFDRATFTGDAEFDRATFTGDAKFDWVTFHGDAEFDRATFTGGAGFYEPTFTGGAEFDGVSLSGQLLFRSVRAAKRLWLAPRGDNVGEVDLAKASFPVPAVLSASSGGTSSRRPKLVSVEQTDTTNLTVAGLDLSDCRFLGAINLERLRIDGKLLLRWSPGWWRARRQVLREEGALRGWAGWETPSPPRAEWASRLQAVYRELRKGREDAKDEPGAADFYYGEMEMRRKAAGGVERWLLTGYWAVSGYGLRASRAVVALLVLLAGATVGFRTIGGYPQHDWRDTSLYAVRTSTSLLRSAAAVPLTRWGQLIEIALRLLAPILLGLAVLAVRGRVKR
jgi:hypothetical protein